MVVTEATHYETPLGAIPVDRAACEQAVRTLGARAAQALEDPELRALVERLAGRAAPPPEAARR